MKGNELRKAATCAVCGHKIGQASVPIFYRVKIERYVLDPTAVRRHSGLEMMLGSAGLAQAMGPNEDLAKPVMEPVEVTVCEDCGLVSTSIAVLVVRAERLQDITEEGARAEGCPPCIGISACGGGCDSCPSHNPRQWYASLWNSIYGKRPGFAWEDCPWVFVTAFKPMEPRA